MSTDGTLTVTMDMEQPDASSSTSSRPDPHLATFVFDPALARDDYVKLIEPEGVIHKLVQRLMEKHGGEKQVSNTCKFDRITPLTERFELPCSSPTRRVEMVS